MAFNHLHVHNEYSYLDGYGSADKFIEQAVSHHQTALAITNHGNVDGAIKFQKSCQAVGIKSIIGCELYVVTDHAVKEKSDKRYHATVLVKSAEGWRNLLQMLTKANLDGYYRRPRVDPAMLVSHCKGLVVLSGCSSSFLGAEWGDKLFHDLCSLLPGDVYLEMMHHDFRDQVSANRQAVRYSKRHNVPLVATGDCHYPSAQDRETQEVLLAIQSKSKWSDPDRWRFSADSYYLASESEIRESYLRYHNYLSDASVQLAIDSTCEIADKCKFEIPRLAVDLPRVPGYESCDETDLLYRLVQKGFRERLLGKERRLAKDLSEYRSRITEELGLICELGFQRYFLIVWDLIRWCRNEGEILVGPGRGSVGGCLVAYLLYITDVDPLRYDLLFTRFISPARIDFPDIDMDFEDRKRDRVRARLEQLYGKDCVAGLSTYLTMKGRGAIRDVSRVFSVPVVDVNMASKSIVVRSGGDFRADFTIADAFETFDDGIAFKKKYPEVAAHAVKLESTVKGLGQHAAAVCISSESLTSGKRAVLADRNGSVVANWEKDDAEYCGLMKLDILGLSTLSVLGETCRLIWDRVGVKISLDSIPLDDKGVYGDISAGHTVGVFQIGSPALARYCKEFSPICFEDLVHINALWRPGTLRTGMTTEFVARRKGGVDWRYDHPALERLTKDTFGIILYQEQVMQFMYDYAGLPWKTCDTVRKVISKSQGDELFMKFKDLFAEGCEAKGTMKRAEAAKLWESLASFGSYSFNKSHSVEYSMISYWCSYLKHYYPAEFMASALSFSGEEKKQELINDVVRLGLKVVPPKFGSSKATLWSVGSNGELLAPFSEIQGVGEKAAEALAAISVADCRSLKPTRSINRTVVSRIQALHASDAQKVDWSDDEIKEIAPLLSFDFSRDLLREIRGIQELVQASGEDIGRVADIEFSHPSKRAVWYFGTMHELRFGYRKNVLKAQKSGGAGSVEVSGQKGSMGGAYGTFTDYTDSCMMVFDGELYAKKKSEVEHCADQIIAIKAAHPQRQTVLFTGELLLESDLRRGCVGSAKLVKRVGDALDGSIVAPGLGDCHLCALREECSRPVLPSIGEYNVAIIGEAPGRTEDRQGSGFLGDAGKVLWKEMGTRKLGRDDVYLTNVVKCWPSQTKTPTYRHIVSCSKWLNKELEEAAPVAILALGGTPLKFFKGKDATGITALNATVEWVPKYKAWVCWGVHPASVLYHQENKPLLAAAVAEFAALVKRLGG